MDFIKKNKKIISIIILALIIYIRCDYGVTKDYAIAMNLIADGIGFIYCLVLTKMDFEAAKKSIFNVAILWLVLFQALQFVYGHFMLFDSNDIYSMQYTILTIGPAVLCYEILWHNREQLIEVLSPVGVIVIIATFITTMKYDYLWEYAFRGEFYRLGEVPGGSDIDTGNLYLLMLIPIFYSIIVLKRIVPYILPALAGMIGIVLTGSKSSALPMVLVIGIMLLSTAKNKRDVKKYIAFMVIFVVVAAIAVLAVPMLYDILGYRLVEVFTAFSDNSGEYDLHTSTGQRLAVIDAFKKHFWEKPILGHGFYSFMTMPYSKLEEYYVDGVISYRNIQTHMNILELLFGFGFVGVITYYWYPVKQFIDVIKSKSHVAKVMGLSFLASIFFMNLGLEMFYKYMTPYYLYLAVYCFLKAPSVDKEN